VKAYDFTKASDRALFYKSKEWLATRALVLAENPYCVECSTDEHPVLAQEVDHIIRLELRPDLRLDTANLQGLCTSCHARKSYEEHLKGTYKKSIEIRPARSKWKNLEDLTNP